MGKPILIGGAEAAAFVGLKGSWFRTLAVSRGLKPAKRDGRGTKFYRKADLEKLKREYRSPGRPTQDPKERAAKQRRRKARNNAAKKAA